MSSSVREVTAAELKQLDRRRFDREYLKWHEWQWDDDWIIEDTQERYANQYKLKGIDIETLHYSVSYSQGDYASFTGRVYLADWMRAVNVAPDGPTYAERWPALYLACDADGSYIDVKGEDDRRGWRADYQENWYNTPPSGIFATMPEEDWEALVLEQASEAGLETEIMKYCRSIGKDIYRDLSDYYLEATSEDAFIESCEANSVTFEIEVEPEDSEEDEHEICCEDQ